MDLTFFVYPGQFIDVRLAALECLVDLVRIEGNFKDVAYLIDIIEKDPVPYIRHRVARMMVDVPPFDRSRRHKNDRVELVDRLWSLMK